jgi:hypothetical protein
MKNEENNYPDPWAHKIVSFMKSATRIVGYALIPFNTIMAVGVLITSEVLGIMEELV